jgi:membrane dipeptidase
MCGCASAEELATDGALAARAALIHQRVLTVDTHVDTPLRLVGGKFDIGQRHDYRQRGGRVDLPRMQDGGLDAIFFAVYMGQGPRTVEGHAKAKDKAKQIFAAVHQAIRDNQELAELALTPRDANRLEAEGKRAIFIGIENGYPIGTDLSLVREYYDLGARYITICHSRNNEICDSSTDEAAEHHGLSPFGEKVVRQMNRLGMMVDVSHASDETFYDVLEISSAPIIASHSCARALCDHPRNLSDDMLRALAQNGGVIQICILGSYIKKAEPNPQRDAAMKELRSQYDDYRSLSEKRKREVYQQWEAINQKYPESTADVSDVVDHIDHVAQVAGIDHVGIGTDFDGGGGLAGCQDVSQLGNITTELVRRGYTEPQIRKIWGGNLMRVFRQVEQAAR